MDLDHDIYLPVVKKFLNCVCAVCPFYTCDSSRQVPTYPKWYWTHSYTRTVAGFLSKNLLILFLLSSWCRCARSRCENCPTPGHQDQYSTWLKVRFDKNIHINTNLSTNVSIYLQIFASWRRESNKKFKMLQTQFLITACE